MLHPWSRALTCSFVLGVIASCNNGGGGGGLVDRGACDLLIECASALAPEARDEYLAVYGAGGSCWQNPSAWASCRDFCRQSLDALNLAAMITGEACGTCQSNADCAEYGVTAYCDAGLCLGGSGGVSDEGETGDGSGGDGDGDNGDGDGDGDTGPNCTPGTLDCICAENDECLDGLVCQLGQCGFCEPGFPGCECDGSECYAPENVCIDGICEEATVGPGPYENCGWNARGGFNECGFALENPVFPVACTNDGSLTQGASCPQWLGYEGCCDMNGDNWWCENDSTAFADCPPG